MSPADLTNRTGRIINSPNGLKLHTTADLKSERSALLANGTEFKIKGVQRNFYHVYVPSLGKFGYVWREKGNDGSFYVEVLQDDLPPPPPPPYPIPETSSGDGALKKSAVVVAIIVAVLGLLYACGGPV